MSGADLTDRDLAALEARWIDAETAERAGLFRVNSVDGAQLVGRNGGGNYAGIAIPNICPGQQQPREYRLRRDVPDLEVHSEGRTREKAKYLHPPGRGNVLYFAPATPEDWLQDANLSAAVTEGEFKCLAIWRLACYNVENPRWFPVGILGCWNWRGTVGMHPDRTAAAATLKA